jgi:hypothetical protein
MKQDLDVAVRTTGALLVIGASLTWLGSVTPMYSRFLWAGVLLLVGGALITGIMTRSIFEPTLSTRLRPLSAAQAVVPVLRKCVYCGSRVASTTTSRCQSCGAPL